MKTIKLEEVTIEISDEQYQELLKSAKPKTKRWKPELNQKFWYMSTYGNIDWSIWNKSEADVIRYDLDNCFKTEEDALDYKAYLEAMTRIKYSSEFVPDWKDQDQAKWSVGYDYARKSLESRTYFFMRFPILAYYATKEEALQAIKDYGEDYLTVLNIKK